MLSERLKFEGEWRPYQAEVLKDLEKHLDDKKIHIVAAPGAGKTVLGIELLRRIGENTLILVPRVSILEQWLNSLDGFLIEGEGKPPLISSDIQNPASITITTYQAVSSLNFDKDLESIGKLKPRTILLDEAHHLTEKWNSDALRIIEKLGIEKTIALTATPPYEVDGASFNAYTKVCGEIDVEISVPELVSHKNLCPHQDYVYVNSPTEEEKTTISDVTDKQLDALNFVINSPRHTSVVEKCLYELETDPEARGLVNAETYLSVIRLAREKRVKIPKIHYRALDINPDNLSKFSLQSLEKYLASVIFNSDDGNMLSGFADQATIDETRVLVPSGDFWNKDKLELVNPPILRQLLRESGNKNESVANIINSEFASLKDALRLVVLVDRIGDGEFLSGSIDSGEVGRKITATSVFSELLVQGITQKLQVALVTGRLVIIPDDLIAQMVAYSTGKSIRISEDDFTKLVGYEGFSYVSGSQSLMADLLFGCTQCLMHGQLKVIVGTGSLLGEGWDCPSINSLVLASQIGSFVSTNQMRGRAIRIDQADNRKVSNIWHLATYEEALIGGGNDFGILERRFATFLGISEKENLITDGFDRVNTINASAKINVEKNAKVLERAADRDGTAQKWFEILAVNKQQHLNFAARSAKFRRKSFLAAGNLFLPKGWLNKLTNPIKFLLNVPRMNLSNFLIKRFCTIVVKALYKNGFISINPIWVKISFRSPVGIIVSCKDRRDSVTIRGALSEIFQITDASRYLLKIKRLALAPVYIGVPSIFGTNKEVAGLFKDVFEREFGKAALIYTKNREGVEELRQALIANEYGSNSFDVETSKIWS